MTGLGKLHLSPANCGTVVAAEFYLELELELQLDCGAGERDLTS